MIERCRSSFSVRMMCERLGVSTSGYYDWRGRSPSARALDNQRLVGRIKALHEASDGVLGSPRITEDLRYEGESCGQNRVARLMRLEGIQGVPVKKRRQPKPSGVRPSGVTNHLARDFAADQPNEKWVTDITFVRTAEGWLYLCVVVDLYSKLVVGWSMSSTQDRQLVIQAVLMALWQRQRNDHVILHSDRGCQFTSDEYNRFLRGHNLTCSMSAVGTCADNAAAEGFFGMLKRERVNRQHYQDRREARADIFDYIERFHNPRQRRRMESRKMNESLLTQLSVKTG
jgi:putative transposase